MRLANATPHRRRDPLGARRAPQPGLPARCHQTGEHLPRGWPPPSHQAAPARLGARACAVGRRAPARHPRRGPRLLRVRAARADRQGEDGRRAASTSTAPRRSSSRRSPASCRSSPRTSWRWSTRRQGRSEAALGALPGADDRDGRVLHAWASRETREIASRRCSRCSKRGAPSRPSRPRPTETERPRSRPRCCARRVTSARGWCSRSAHRARGSRGELIVVQCELQRLGCDGLRPFRSWLAARGARRAQRPRGRPPPRAALSGGAPGSRARGGLDRRGPRG
jgi:hypothetical protein